jgi:hypothetical protein
VSQMVIRCLRRSQTRAGSRQCVSYRQKSIIVLDECLFGQQGNSRDGRQSSLLQLHTSTAMSQQQQAGKSDKFRKEKGVGGGRSVRARART